MKVLVLEPDYWRYLGILQVLESDPSVILLGDADHKQILSLRTAPARLTPDAVIVSHSLTIDYQLSILEHLHDLFPSAKLLVEGYEETLDSIATILRAGAKGYFQLSSEPSKLLTALAVVSDGHIWAPRDAVALMVRQIADESGDDRASTLVEPGDVSILKLLQRGLSNEEIAQSLGVAAATIKAHLTKRYRKFGVRTRLELLAYALTHHLIADRQHGGRQRGSPREA